MANHASKDFLVFGQPKIEQPEIDEVVDSMQKAWLGTGPKVAQFEQDFARYKGVDHVAALNSCTAALHLSLLAADIGPGDEVITTPMTFCATVNAIIHAGATPVLADIDPDTFNISPERIKEKITSRTRAIVPVHFAGRPCNMEAIMAIAHANGLKVIEDCAHAIETEYHGRKTGTFGDFGCFSFYATKNITTGEGGMVIAQREEDIERIKVLGLHGMSKDAWNRFGDDGYKHYYVVESGFKYNMMDLQAAIGIHQLKRIESNWHRRSQIWSQYMQAFEGLPLGLPACVEKDTRHGYHLFTVLIDQEKVGISRDQFLSHMTEKSIGVGVHYLSLPEHPFYQKSYGWKTEDYPNAALVGRQTVSLPISAKLTQQDLDYVIQSVKNAINF
ncbi:DegT/DnrJ/EryC1/StrS family aminotransferase [Janthinobacterium sp. 17J80-10]|uniref:DegT/DnrJ/EryC1/StrS family aminotransferase n=1 Tax=Janthinobacterium sp. 17J80-10 TaxID=2497863 RepID=UPI0010053DE4|nr:DegT/DnrJ/EryC1/StrS family aminotransferase [Janthinobacterium sp. 17J80-10]QAU33628.1 DegT/DnrJ/EryC1/StrS family aminotransferase [Janthinobacterium sp. 17J80-10]